MWSHRSAALWRRCTATQLAARWWALSLAVLYGLGTLGALWLASATWGAATPPAAHTPSQAMTDGRAAFQRGDFPGAALRWQEAARLYTETTQPQARSVALTYLARAYEALGHTDRAEESLRTALPLAETAGDQAQAALILGHLGELAL